MLPEGWTAQRGDEVSAKITKGASPKWQGFDYQEAGVLFVTSENVRDGFLDISKPKYLPHGFSQKQKNSRLSKGDILINIVGASIGRSCRFGVGDIEANINQAVCLLRPKTAELSAYLSHYLQSAVAKAALLGQQSESARPNLTLEDIRGFHFPVPPLQERLKIAEILSTWDSAIAAVEKLIANARTQKTALMQQLLTGTKRLPGFVLKWSKTTIGQIAQEISERDQGHAGFPVLSCSKYDGMVASLSYFNKKVYSDDTSNYKVMRRGAFGFPSNHIEEGSIGYQDICDIGIVSPIYCVFRADETVQDGFLYKLLKSDRYRQIFSAATNASVNRRGSLRWKEFRKIDLLLPILEEQIAINEVIETAARDERAYGKQLSALRQEKSALMQQLLTGKRRVTIDAPAATLEEVAA